MARIAQENAAQFARLRAQGHSYREIGRQFGVDPRSVKSGIAKIQEAAQREHWESVTRELDVKYLEEHHRMLAVAALGVANAVRSLPSLGDDRQEASVLVDYHVAASLQAIEELLATRGLNVGSRWSEATGDRDDALVERLARRLQDGLMDHEPGIRSAIGDWKLRWGHFGGQRDQLVPEATRLLGHRGYKGESADRLAKIAVEQALEQALTSRDAYEFTVEMGEAGTSDLAAKSGRSRQVLLSGTVAHLDTVGEALKELIKQVHLRLEQALETYEAIRAASARVQSLVDDLLLRGRPSGTCSLCPANASTVIQYFGRNARKPGRPKP